MSERVLNATEKPNLDYYSAHNVVCQVVCHMFLSTSPVDFFCLLLLISVLFFFFFSPFFSDLQEKKGLDLNLIR